MVLDEGGDYCLQILYHDGGYWSYYIYLWRQALLFFCVELVPPPLLKFIKLENL